jgi:hypothetical protein
LVFRLIGPSEWGPEDDQLALGKSSLNVGSWRSAITVSSGIFSRGGDGSGGGAALLLVGSGNSGLTGGLARERKALSGATGESFLAIIDGALDGRVGVGDVRGTRLGAGSDFSSGGKSETEIGSGEVVTAAGRVGKIMMSNARTWVASDKAKKRHTVVELAIIVYYRLRGREESRAKCRTPRSSGR